MKLLALETSGPVAGAAVLADGKVVAEQYLDHGLTHSEVILPLAERALQDAGLTAGDIDVFAADAGPGSFTGVRIGVCAVNAMAAALGKQVVAVDSLTILACNAAAFEGVISPIVDARSDRIYAAAFFAAERYPALYGGLCACTVGEWIERLHECENRRILFLGDGAIAHKEELRKAFGGRASFALTLHNYPRASACALVAESYAASGEAKPEIVPIYLRESQAERSRQAGEAREERAEGTEKDG